MPGDSVTSTFTIKNPTNKTLTISINPNTLSLIEKTQFDNVYNMTTYLINGVEFRLLFNNKILIDIERD